MFKKIAILMLFIPLFMYSYASAAETMIQVTGRYIANTSESINDAKKHALEDAVRQATEKAGVLVISYSKTLNAVLTEDEVKTIASEVLSIRSQKYIINIVNDSGMEAIADVEVIVETKNIDDNIARILLKNKELKESNEKLESINIEIQNELQYYRSIEEMEKYIKNKYTMEKVEKMHPWTYVELMRLKKQERTFITNIALAHYYMALGNWDNAISCLISARIDEEKLSNMMGHEYKMDWRMKRELGEVYFMIKEYRTADKYFSELYAIFLDVKNEGNKTVKRRKEESSYYFQMIRKIVNYGSEHNKL